MWLRCRLNGTDSKYYNSLRAFSINHPEAKLSGKVLVKEVEFELALNQAVLVNQ